MERFALRGETEESYRHPYRRWLPIAWRQGRVGRLLLATAAFSGVFLFAGQVAEDEGLQDAALAWAIVTNLVA